LPGRAQPSPKLVAPTSLSAPAAVRPNSGPPESPWQVSTPPCGKPAHSIVAASKSLYAAAQSASVVTGTCASCSVSGVSPPSDVVAARGDHLSRRPESCAVQEWCGDVASGGFQRRLATVV
jgi:hypothetical protein